MQEMVFVLVSALALALTPGKGVLATLTSAAQSGDLAALRRIVRALSLIHI